MTLYGFQATRRCSRKSNWRWPKDSKLKTLKSYTMFSVCLLNDIEDQEHFRLHRRNILQESLNDSIWKTASQYPLYSNKEEPVREDEDDVLVYQMATGCSTYAATIRRLDLADAVGVLSKFMPKPGKKQWQDIEQMLRYIQGALNYGLVFKADGTDPILTGYSDADWGGDVSTRGSTSGYVFQIQGNTISWSSRKPQKLSISQ